MLRKFFGGHLDCPLIFFVPSLVSGHLFYRFCKKKINSQTNTKKKILIATQGSEYKNDVVSGITDKFKNKSIYIKIIDVSLLGWVNPDELNAIIILHTWEIWKPEENSEKFLKKYFDSSKMFALATSGSGDNMIDGMDGITGASSLDLIDKDPKTIRPWLSEVLKITNTTK